MKSRTGSPKYKYLLIYQLLKCFDFPGCARLHCNTILKESKTWSKTQKIPNKSNGSPGGGPGMKVYPKLACRLGFCHYSLTAVNSSEQKMTRTTKIFLSFKK